MLYTASNISSQRAYRNVWRPYPIFSISWLEIGKENHFTNGPGRNRKYSHMWFWRELKELFTEMRVDLKELTRDIEVAQGLGKTGSCKLYLFFLLPEDPAKLSPWKESPFLEVSRKHHYCQTEILGRKGVVKSSPQARDYNHSWEYLPLAKPAVKSDALLKVKSPGA